MDSDAEQRDVVARLARATAAGPTDEPLPLRLCRACASILHVDGGSLSLEYAAPAQTTLCVTSAEAAVVDDAQEVLGNGPSFLAVSEKRPVALILDSDHPHWASFTNVVRQSIDGPLTVFAVPIIPSVDPIGVATFYRHSADASLPIGTDTVQLLINAVGIALVHDPDLIPEHQQTKSWAERSVIYQATGMIMSQLRVSPEDATALLRAHAYAHSTSMIAISREVTDRKLDFRRHDPDPEPDQKPTDPDPGEEDRS